MNPEIDDKSYIWWLLRADDLVDSASRLIDIANTVSVSDTNSVDSVLLEILEILPLVNETEKKIGIPFPYKQALIDARLKLVFEKNSSHIE